MRLLLWLLLLPLTGFAAGDTGRVQVCRLTCEYLVSPPGIDRTHPLLGWQLQGNRNGLAQTAWQVLVASSPEKLQAGTGDVWNSGKVVSFQSQQVRYQGPALESGKQYWWKVKIWDEQNLQTDWSPPASWSMGLLAKEDWQGRWISARYAPVSAVREHMGTWSNVKGYTTIDTAAVYLRKIFHAGKTVKRATVYICGLGYYELYINGRKTGNRVLDPVFTDYQRQVSYATYDVTAALRRGGNALGVILGNGFYNSPTPDLFQMENAHWKTPPRLLLDLHIEYANGTKAIITSDTTWKWSTGEIVYNSIRSGETIDHRRRQQGWNNAGFRDRHWQPAVGVPPPTGRLQAQYMPPLRINENIPPQRIFQPRKGVYVVDFGKNITGWISLRIKEPAGRRIICRYNEVLHPDSTVDMRHSSGHTRGRFQLDELITAGNGPEYFEPRFTYHGFRYVQLEGLTTMPQLSDLAAKSVHTALDTTGYFSCSDQRLNNLQHAVQRTLLNSIHSMPGEEPTREKMGWTLDAGVTMESYLYNFDALNTYKKTLQDFMDAQESSGHIPSIVPTNGWSFLTPAGQPIQFDDPWWGGTIFFIAEKLWEHTGDTAIIAHAFPAMKAYVDYVSTTAKDGLVYWSLGDWLDLTFNNGPGLTPVVQTSTAAWYWMCERLAAFARLLGEDGTAQQYTEQASRIRDRFNSAFLDSSTGWYAKGSQTAQALPLYLGLTPDAAVRPVTDRLLEAIAQEKDHISAGFVGVLPFLNYLPLHGYDSLAWRIIAQPESPGYLHMVTSTSSTLGENLNSKGYGSGHHPYAAHIGFWLYKYLGGIRTDPAHPGFRQFIIAPLIVPGLDSMTCKTHSLYGEIVSAWKKESGGVTINLSVPGNTSATVILPAGAAAALRAAGLPVQEEKHGRVTVQVGAGKYAWRIARL